MPRKPFPELKNIEVTRFGGKGKAIGTAPDGRVIFIPFAAAGDTVNVQVTKKRKGYYEGRITEILAHSEHRTQPRCTHFGICGGCKWQHLDYQEQLKHKQQEILDNLKRIGKLEVERQHPILSAKGIYHYRNKMEFSFSSNRWITPEEIEAKKEITNRNALGFHTPGVWDKVLDIENCHLQEDPSNAIRNHIKDFAIQNGMGFFNARSQTGFLRTLMIRIANTGQIMVLLQFFKEDKEKRELLLESIKNNFDKVGSLLYVINSKANDTIYDQEVICYHGNDHIIETLQDLKFKIHAKSFYQTNSAQAEILYNKVKELCGLTGEETVFDLYSGIGSIALFVAKGAKKMVGVESVPDAVEDAKENALTNNIKNATFYCGDMKNVLNDQLVIEHGKPDLVITDPPREGMHAKVVGQLLRMKPEKIVYVSCNSATQARDLQLLSTAYKVVESQGVDMFPQTHHIENVVLLQKV